MLLLPNFDSIFYKFLKKTKIAKNNKKPKNMFLIICGVIFKEFKIKKRKKKAFNFFSDLILIVKGRTNLKIENSLTKQPIFFNQMVYIQFS